MPFGFGADGPHYPPEGQLFTYEELDRASRELAGESLYDYMRRIDAVREHFADEPGFRAAYHAHVGTFRLGSHAGRIALYSAYAEEASFEPDDDGGLTIAAFTGMNVSHRIVAAMLAEMLEGVSVDADGSLRGVARLMVDAGAEANTRAVEVDFDAGTVSPALRVRDSFGLIRAVTADEVAAFIADFLPLRELDTDAISIFIEMPDMPTIRHELLHALFVGRADWRERVRDLARRTDAAQRETAVLFAAINYDVFDPDMAVVNPDIVLDEAFNAYGLEGRFDIDSGHSWFSIGDYLRARGIPLSLSAYAGLDALPVDAGSLALLRMMHAESGLSETAFLREWEGAVFDNLHCMRLLRTLVMEQHPDEYRRVRRARRALVDGRLD